MSSSAYRGHLGLHALAKRRQWVCAYCDRKTHCPVCNPELDGQLQATRDHRIPRSKGGSNGTANLVLACFRCNQDKADRFIEDGLPEPAPAVILPTRSRRSGTGHKFRNSLRRGAAPWQSCAEGWHKSEKQAVSAIRALQEATGHRYESYRCMFCQHWHIERDIANELSGAC